VTREAFPWVRTAGACELCGRRADVLVRVEVESGTRIRVAHNVPGRASREGRRLARVVLVCRRHPGSITNGAPLAIPRKTMARGTTAKEPQRERLFDVAAYKRAGWQP
jgi:hypothetical protein